MCIKYPPIQINKKQENNTRVHLSAFKYADARGFYLLQLIYSQATGD
jgi:hypothetical protein